VSSTDPFAGVDPTSLAENALAASALAYYLDGEIASADPTTQAAILNLMSQDSSMAQAAVMSWLKMSIDPSTIQTGGVMSKYECTDLGCPYTGKCYNSGSSWDGISHRCSVTDCGVSQCTKCPDWFPPFLKHLVFKSWCAYVCVQTGITDPPVVAIGAVGVQDDGTTFPKPGLIWCFDPINPSLF
jgi:hypothetical protein